MLKRVLVVIIMAIILLSAFSKLMPITPISAQGSSFETIEVSLPKQLTTNPKFDRNPGFFKAIDGTWWVFFARGRGDPLSPGYNPDTDFYDVCYVKSTDNGLTWTDGALPNIPDDHGMGAFTPAAFQDDSGKIWVFYAANGVGVFYFVSTDNGGTWIGPNAVPNVTGYTVDNHMDAIKANNGNIWIFFTCYPDNALYARKYDGTNWSGLIFVANPLSYTATPRAMQEENGTFRVIYIAGDPLQIYLASSVDGIIWTNSPIINTPNDDYDPVLVKDGATWRLFFAPYILAEDHQWLMTINSSDLTTWSTPVYVTAGRYGTNKWWDFWPEAVKVGSDLLLFYASMKDGTQRGDGEIYMYKVDWDLTGNHFEFIQSAIEAASLGDIILIHDGIYYESLYISESLTLKAADNPVIRGAEMRATNYGNRQATIFVENALNVVLEGLDVEGQGLGIPAGTKSYAVLYENSSGTIRSCTVSPNTIGDMYSTAVALWDNSAVTIEKCVIKNFGRIGVYSNNATSLIQDNEIVGQVYSLDNQVNYGIEIEDYTGPSIAEIVRNKIYDCNNTHPSPLWSSAAIIVDIWMYYNQGSMIPSTVSIENNEIYDNYEAVEITKGISSHAHYNTIYNNLYGIFNWGANYGADNATFDARFNWWGDISGPYHPTTNSIGLGDEIGDNVDYSPWLGAPFEVTPKTYHVNPAGAPNAIQEAINEANPGDAIIVHEGFYDEQVVIGKSLTLQGVGDATIVRPSSAGKLTTVLSGYYWGGTKQIAGIIVANANGDNVIIKDITIDGENVVTKPTGADYVAGIFYRETSGTIDSVIVDDMTIGATGTAVRGYGIYLSAIANTVFVEVKESTLTNFDKNGIDVHGSKLTVNIHHNTITGRGSLPFGDEVQNGVVIMDGAAGAVNNNVISNMAYTPETYWSAGILFMDSSGSASANVITDCQIGIIFQDGSGLAQNNTVTGGTVGLLGIWVQYTKEGTWTATFVGNTISGARDSPGYENGAVGAQCWNEGALITLTVSNNEIIGDGTTSADGIYIGDIPEYEPAGNITAIITNNIISGWQHGIRLVSSITEATITGNTIKNNIGTNSGIHIEEAITTDNIHVNYNNIFGNNQTGAYGIFNGGTGTLDASYNWWGHPTGPYHPTLNPLGKGDRISNNVAFEPWLIEPYPPPTEVEALLYVDPAYVEYWTVSSGKILAIDVKIANVTSLHACEFKLYWNTLLLDLVKVEITPPWSAYNIAKNETDEALGRYWLSMTSLGTSTFSGSTTLVKLTFKITFDPIYPENRTCILDLSDTKLSAPEGVPIYHMTHDGQYGICSTKPRIIVEPPIYTAHAINEIFTINITVQEVVNLYNFSFRLNYNTTILDVIDLEVGPFLNPPIYKYKFMIDDANGHIWLWVWSTSGTPTSGSGVLARITFKVTKATTWTQYHPNIFSCALHLHDTLLVTNTGIEVEHDVADGLYRYEPKPGDLDMDGYVGLTDLRILAYYYDPSYDPLADLNEDGKVDVYDLSILAYHYGEDC